MAYRAYLQRKTNPENKNIQKKRNKVRTALREKNILPPYGEPLNEIQQKIWEQISNNDFSYWESIKEKTNETPSLNYLPEKRNQVRKSLRQKGILPNYGEPLDEIQQEIWDQISNNDFSYWNSIKYDGTYDPNPNNKRTPIRENEYLLWYRAKENSKARKFEFNIDVEDIVIPEKCPYLNITLTTSLVDCQKPNYYSIDRIDSKKGYVKDNVQVISRLANTMKNNATIEQLIMFAEGILKTHPKI